MRHATSYAQSSGAGGVYYNLLDSHAPFQIDGNLGYTAAVTEMLLQSHGETMRLLPALPSTWKDGSLRGIRCEGNFEIDQEWTEGKLTSATVRSGSGRDARICYAGISSAKVTDANGKEVAINIGNNDNISFPTEAGGIYTILPNGGSGVEAVSASATFEVTVADHRVTVKGADNPSIEVFNTAGVLVASGSGQSLSLEPLASQIIIVKVSTTSTTKTVKAAI